MIGAIPSSFQMKQSWHPEIDGLRGLAVVLVVCYHVGLPGFSGGFVGVDVFFVISGFLITRQLITMRDKPALELLKDFYARRARRILPALVLLLMGTLALGKLLLLPSGEQQDLAKSAVATSVFASNLYFWKAIGSYFAGPTELQPLLHTWSLAVEEQFYLFWPFLLIGLWGVERRVHGQRRAWLTAAGILAVSLLSLLISIVWTRSAPTAAFYLTPSRVWEIGAGALLATGTSPRPRAQRSWIGPSVGLGAILAASWRYSGATPFPGLAALVPVAGASLIILTSSVRQDTHGLVRGLLRSRPLGLFGRVSYSWYLWHWPLLAIARAVSLGNRNPLRDTLLAGIAFVIAYLSTRYIESPIRSRRIKLFNKPYIAAAAAAASLIVALSGSGLLWAEARSFYRSTLAPQSMSCLSNADAAFSGVVDPTAGDPMSACTLATGHRGPVFLIGDSHANHWSPAISEWAASADVGAYERSFPGCPVVLLGFPNTLDARRVTRFSRECQVFSRRSIAELRNHARGSGAAAVIGVHWSYLADSGDAEALIRGLDVALDSLDRMGVRSLVIGPTPLLEESAPECVARRSDDYCRLARSRFDTEEGSILADLTAVIARHPADRIFDPTPTYCDARWCYPRRDGMLLFRDRSHLSRAGAEAARGRLGPYLDWLTTKDSSSPARILSAATAADGSTAVQ